MKKINKSNTYEQALEYYNNIWPKQKEGLLSLRKALEGNESINMFVISTIDGSAIIKELERDDGITLMDFKNLENHISIVKYKNCNIKFLEQKGIFGKYFEEVTNHLKTYHNNHYAFGLEKELFLFDKYLSHVLSNKKTWDQTPIYEKIQTGLVFSGYVHTTNRPIIIDFINQEGNIKVREHYLLSTFEKKDEKYRRPEFEYLIRGNITDYFKEAYIGQIITDKKIELICSNNVNQ